MKPREKPFQLWAVWSDNKGYFVSGHDTQEEADAALERAVDEDVGMFDHDEYMLGEFKVMKKR